MCTTVTISEAAPGDVLAESIYDAETTLLLREGVALTNQMLDMLLTRGREWVRIEPRDVLDDCASCGTQLALRKPNGVARPWACNGCGKVYFGKAPESASSAVPADLTLEPVKKLDLTAEEEAAFNEVWEKNQRVGVEQRKHERHAVKLPATVLPLDGKFMISGEPVELTTQDISQGGACLRHTEAFDHPYAYIHFKLPANRELRMLAKVVRNRDCGGAWEIGLKYTSRVIEHSDHPPCSVAGCGATAAYHAHLYYLDSESGDLTFEPDDSCPQLCHEHMLENERLAIERPNSIASVRYPHTNRNGRKGVTVYHPVTRCEKLTTA
ncbi:PilZ domain protein [Pseudobythopirellula maris]|uniref:PilZ domain protein n=1 Tax=Pseudobythopirellula maris TaxID=2527991 RepID=A0A5C5ZQA5_9BACT|nr:PilZ domain-containing protein [Pseudobythopirellula maris]TWT89669.1 PilZ domain protein [Pseudobythopirellula maris]